jgi:hypothetical protein
MDLGILARAASIEDFMGASGTFRQSDSYIVHLGMQFYWSQQTSFSSAVE